MTLGENIRRIRKEKGLSQSDLAKKLGVPYQQIGQYENAKRNPKLETIAKLARALEVPIVELIGKETYTVKIGKGKVFSKEQNKFVDYCGEYLDLTDRAKLLDAYDSLNTIGQKEALKRIDELTLLEKYTKNDPDQDQEN